MDTIIPSSLDFANHGADATKKDIQTLCDAVVAHKFNSAFVNPIHIKDAKAYLQGKSKVGTVISFPLGQDIRDVKIHAIREAVQNGVDELDIVPDISRLKEGDEKAFEEELITLVTTAKSMRAEVIVKFIIETGLFLPAAFLHLDTPEIQQGKELVKQASLAIVRSGADFIKICSGMGKRGVSPDDVVFIRSLVGPDMKIKGAGGVHTREQALTLFKAGANRLGTSQAPAIINAL
jgi:deoxyribose-phosphate aldolase